MTHTSSSPGLTRGPTLRPADLLGSASAGSKAELAVIREQSEILLRSLESLRLDMEVMKAVLLGMNDTAETLLSELRASRGVQP